ncbi:hypothetical protein N3K66_003821 [Trichothecium roseum]|uniref:Uncharacterized protein n=1 Tax=Trichothecium roseum TaxID=47278 RepID=A0ACC0V6L8_9HYPO|nr:hypothetical protein N3K66_003821 [Trichothecium roseum]
MGHHDEEAAVPKTSVDYSSTSSADTPVRLEPIRTTRTNLSQRSVGSRRLDGTDPYENLEHCLSHDPEMEIREAETHAIGQTKTAASAWSTASRPPDFEVIFEDGDPENPKNWPFWYRTWILVVVAFTCWVVVLYSTSYTSSTPGLVKEFGSSTTITTLGMTMYLLGLATGSLIVAPLSELYGRRPVYMICLCIWALLILPSALAKSLTAIIVSRYFCAVFGAVMISNSPGTVVDLSQPEYLALTMSLWSIAPLNGPSLGGIIGGFVFQYLGWRWSNWLVLILGGVAIACMATVKETYAPQVLKQKAARLRKETGDDRWWCQYEVKMPTSQLIKTNLSRPFILFATEPILWFLNAWVSLVYGVLYLCFVAYPIVFSQHRGWSPGISGLAFCGMGLGTLIAIFSEPLIRKIINAQPRDPETGKVVPESIALIMAIGSILSPIGQLVFAWTCLPASIHWAVPIAFGIPFGVGNTLCFIYASNYLAGAYGIYAASALAGNAVLRSIFGGVLPLAGPKMYAALTPQWAGTLLGLMEVVMIPIPFIFWRYGSKIRAKSRVIRQLREDQERLDEKRARNLAKLQRNQERAARNEPKVLEKVDEN